MEKAGRVGARGGEGEVGVNQYNPSPREVTPSPDKS